MSQPDNTPTWLAWVSPLVAILGALWILARRLFVTREDLERMLSEKHKENVHRFERQDAELKEIRETVARIDGQLSGRYPRIDR